jgi:hypothetical protein
VSYLDFTFVGYGTREAGRLVRFMAKDAVFKHPGQRPAHARHAPHPRSIVRAGRRRSGGARPR